MMVLLMDFHKALIIIADHPPADNDEDGHYAEEDGGDDCDDNDASVYLGAPEICDGKDNDCDGPLSMEMTQILHKRIHYSVQQMLMVTDIRKVLTVMIWIIGSTSGFRFLRWKGQ